MVLIVNKNILNLSLILFFIYIYKYIYIYMDYYRKYLKYKSKYLNELNKIGGAERDSDDDYDDDSSASAVPHSRDLRRPTHHKSVLDESDDDETVASEEQTKKPLELENYTILNLVEKFEILNITGIRSIPDKYVFLLQNHPTNHCLPTEIYTHRIRGKLLASARNEEKSIRNCRQPTVENFISKLAKYSKTNKEFYYINANYTIAVPNDGTSFHSKQIDNIDDNLMVLQEYHDEKNYIANIDKYINIYQTIFNTETTSENRQAQLISDINKLFTKEPDSFGNIFAKLIGFSSISKELDKKFKFVNSLHPLSEEINTNIINQYCLRQIREKIQKVKDAYKAKQEKIRFVPQAHGRRVALSVVVPPHPTSEESYKIALDDLNNFFRKSILYTYILYNIYISSSKICIIYVPLNDEDNTMLKNMFVSFYKSVGHKVSNMQVSDKSYNDSNNYITLNKDNWDYMLELCE
jgi:hypothetical protein